MFALFSCLSRPLYDIDTCCNVTSSRDVGFHLAAAQQNDEQVSSVPYILLDECSSHPSGRVRRIFGFDFRCEINTPKYYPERSPCRRSIKIYSSSSRIRFSGQKSANMLIKNLAKNLVKTKHANQKPGQKSGQNTAETMTKDLTKSMDNSTNRVFIE